MNQNENLQKLYLTYFFFILAATIFAQAPVTSQTDFGIGFSDVLFWRAPSVNGVEVKEIKEWRNYGDNKVVLGDHYTFRSGGALTAALITDGYEDKQFYFTYTSGERFHWIYQHEKYDSTTYIFAYKEGQDIVEMHFGDTRRKTFYYKNEKRQVIEKKEFFKDVSKKEKFDLSSRTVYNYNQKDSLFGEMHYTYHSNEKPTTKKVIHHYDLSSGLKVRTNFYNQDGLPHESDHFYYNEKGQLIKIVRSSDVLKDYTFFQKLFIYQNNQLQRKESSFYLSGQRDKENLRKTEVYREGRLVYKKLKTSDGSVVESNYQYIPRHKTKT